MAKEAEKAEEHKMRNMVQGLKKDETDFLDFVATKQMEVLFLDTFSPWLLVGNYSTSVL